MRARDRPGVVMKLTAERLAAILIIVGLTGVLIVTVILIVSLGALSGLE